MNFKPVLQKLEGWWDLIIVVILFLGGVWVGEYIPLTFIGLTTVLLTLIFIIAGATRAIPSSLFVKFFLWSAPMILAIWIRVLLRS